MFGGFFGEMFDLEPLEIEVWDVVIFTHVNDSLRKLGIKDDHEYILLEKYHKGAIYVNAMDFHNEVSEYDLTYLEYPHEDFLFKVGRTYVSMQEINEAVQDAIFELKCQIDEKDLPEFLDKLNKLNYKNNVQVMIDSAIDEGNFELAKEYMDKYGGILK